MKTESQFQNPPLSPANWYKRLFAYMIANSGRQYDSIAAERKRRLFGGLRGTILEIGPGAGPNLAFYAPDIRWVGVETNPAMLPYLQQEARRLGRPIELRDGGPEILPAESASVDAVVSTLVLCSVPNLTKTLQEIMRVLKPGGKFAFIEHVAAPRGTSLRRAQTLIRPLWQALGDGCHVDRETWVAIEQAGFSQVQLEHFRLDVPIVSPQIAGVAIK
ncbi:MAG TPA: class I SAM-dependent methyltransferase [Polyangia bacterium]